MTFVQLDGAGLIISTEKHKVHIQDITGAKLELLSVL
jgi:hypothetical protein